MYGSRGRIGLITLATDASVLQEHSLPLPPGVSLYSAPIPLPRGEVTPAALSEMLAGEELERAARLLTAIDPGLILFACTTGSLVHGVGWDRELIARIERAAGRQGTTTTTAVLAALRAVGATSLAIATPYVAALNEIERRFFEASGFHVAAIAGLQCPTDAAIGRLTPQDAIDLVARVDRPEADAIFISCTTFHCLEAIAEIEARHGKPVITSNQAGIWFALRQIGINDPVLDHGRLLTLPDPHVPASSSMHLEATTP
ncbi:MAG: maleate cis-trans isomerase [Chloroflexota bacterium]|nr:maleate cis-trans isomerase [Chloroflexota bacterium]